MRLRIICTSAGNFEFTYTSAGNFYAQVLVNAYTEFYIHGKYIPMTKNNKITTPKTMKYSKKHVKNSKFSKKREIDAIWQKIFECNFIS